MYKLTSADTGSTMTGKFFSFKASAINVVGESALSPEIVIIAAQIPLAATNLAKVSSNTMQITFSWTAADP